MNQRPPAAFQRMPIAYERAPANPEWNPVGVAAGKRREPNIALPSGQGLDYPAENGEPVVTGVPANELTSLEWRDPLAGTPWHKHVPARVEAARPLRAPSPEGGPERRENRAGKGGASGEFRKPS